LSGRPFTELVRATFQRRQRLGELGLPRVPAPSTRACGKRTCGDMRTVGRRGRDTGGGRDVDQGRLQAVSDRGMEPTRMLRDHGRAVSDRTAAQLTAAAAAACGMRVTFRVTRNGGVRVTSTRRRRARVKAAAAATRTCHGGAQAAPGRCRRGASGPGARCC
jgi:hypothetical protein